jgi:hypothetical protein
MRPILCLSMKTGEDMIGGFRVLRSGPSALPRPTEGGILDGDKGLAFGAEFRLGLPPKRYGAATQYRACRSQTA